jgi:hypothetical protein
MDKAQLVAILLLGGYLLNGCGGGSATPPPAAILFVTVPSATVPECHGLVASFSAHSTWPRHTLSE